MTQSVPTDARGTRAKRVLLVWIALASGLAVLAWSQTWFTIERIEGVQLAQPADASGAVAAPPLMALALAGFAAVAGLALAGLVLRWLLGVLVVVLGGVAVATSAIAAADPVRAVARLVTELTGVTGHTSTVQLVDPEALTVTVWPWIGILAGTLLAAAGIAVVITARRWPTNARRFETRFADAESGLPIDSVERWDALSSGDDPTATTAELDESFDDDGDDEEARGGGAGEVPPRND